MDVQQACFKPDTLIQDFEVISMALRPSASRGYYSSGKVLSHQGRSAQHVYQVISGFVKVLHERSNGDEIVVSIRGAGWPVGSAAALLGAASQVSVVTLTDCMVLEVPTTTFVEAMSSSTPCLQALLRIHSRKIQEQIERFAVLTCENAKRRVESVLRTFAGQFGTSLPDGSIRLNVPLTQHELAKLTQVTPETMCRTLAELERTGAIGRNRGRITVHAPLLAAAEDHH